MRKMIATTLVVAHVLTGCGATNAVFSAESPAKQRTIGQSTNGQKRTVLPLDKAQNRTYIGKQDPARHGTVMKSAGAGGASPAGALAPAADTEQTGVAGFLKLEKAPGEVNVVPILTDTGELERLMFSPAEGTLTWEVAAAEGPVAVKTIRLTLQSLAEYPGPVTPDAGASEAGVTTEPPTPTGSLVPRDGEPITVDLDTAALNWPVQLKAGSQSKLAFKLDTPAIRDFLSKSFGTARVKLKLQFLDPTGTAIANDQGKAFTLEQTVDVM